MLNSLINFCIDFFSLFFRFIPESNGILNYILIYAGDGVCILICCLVALLSRFYFKKTFSHRRWKLAFIIIIGGYLSILVMNSVPLTFQFFANGSGNFFIEMDELMGYFISLLFPVLFLFLFTVVYTIHFLIRLVKDLKDRGKKEKEDDEACTAS